LRRARCACRPGARSATGSCSAPPEKAQKGDKIHSIYQKRIYSSFLLCIMKLKMEFYQQLCKGMNQGPETIVFETTRTENLVTLSRKEFLALSCGFYKLEHKKRRL
jgi:hypothetical protein